MVDSDRFDDVDRALLHALQIDGRAPFRRIGDVLGVSDQTIGRRYATLRRTRALRVVGLSDHAALDSVHWILRVRTTPDAAGEIADALARRPDTSWIDLCSGGTEIVSAAHGTGVESLLLDALPRTRHVLDVRADQVLHTFYGGTAQPFSKGGPLVASQVAQLAVHLPGPTELPRHLDAVDQRILEVLRGDGRASVEELVTAANVSASSVRRRLHTLRAGGVLHLDVDVDLTLLELPMRTMLWLTVTPAELSAVGQALAGHADVAYAASTTGPANVFATAMTHDPAALYRYLTTAVAVIPGVTTVETAPVLRHVKDAVTYHGPRLAAERAAARRR